MILYNFDLVFLEIDLVLTKYFIFTGEYVHYLDPYRFLFRAGNVNAPFFKAFNVYIFNGISLLIVNKNSECTYACSSFRELKINCNIMLRKLSCTDVKNDLFLRVYKCVTREVLADDFTFRCLVILFFKVNDEAGIFQKLFSLVLLFPTTFGTICESSGAPLLTYSVTSPVTSILVPASGDIRITSS